MNNAPLKYVPPALAGKPFFPGAQEPNFPTYLSPPRQNFPLVLSPDNPANEFSIEDWAVPCREQLDSLLHNVGAILFRGLPLYTAMDFNTFIVNMGYPSLSYQGGAALRDKVASDVMTASDEPLELSMDLHTEMSYLPHWPSKVVFFCVQPPEENNGGETPIAKFDGVLEELDPKLLEKLKRKGVRYYRNIGDRSDNKYVSWQHTFHTNDRKEVERFCREQGYEVTWNDDNSITLYVTLPATINHPTTGEELWFNQITSSHSSYYKVHPAFMNEEKEPTKYPLHTSYGDGEEFTDNEISHMRILQWNKAVGFQWQTSDVLVVDNLTTAHGRIGATFDYSQRKILASLLDN
ncbi:dapdiamide synthesis protein DdaC-like [Glandiceps talaboti]